MFLKWQNVIKKKKVVIMQVNLEALWVIFVTLQLRQEEGSRSGGRTAAVSSLTCN